MLLDQQKEAHQQAVLQWNLKRRERKQLEKDLLKYQVSTVQRGCPTDQEIEQARGYVTKEHMRVFREEFPYAKRYFETTLIKMDPEEDD